MHLSLDDFCEIVSHLKKSTAEKAVAILWFHDHSKPGIVMLATQLAKILDDYHLGAETPASLWRKVTVTGLANQNGNGFFLKPGSRKLIQSWLPSDIDGMQPPMDHTSGYLPEPVWKNTRGYIDEVCRELNGCFRAGYYNAASVMLRRLFETLIIEVYEHLRRESEIKGKDGHYLMLSDLVDHACGERGHAGLNLGRNTKAALKEVRDKGNLSAHSRRYLANAPDLTNIQTGIRVAAQELILLADLQRKP